MAVLFFIQIHTITMYKKNRRESIISNEYAILVSGLKKAYKNKPVLDDVNFEVKKGIIYSLLGSNGAGKTTTIKILTTLTNADAGEVKVCHYDAAKEPEKIHQVISLTGQYASVDESLTGFENLVLIGKYII